MTAADEYRAYTDALMKRMRRRSKAFRVETDTEADWCLRRMAELESRIVARAEFVQMEIARLQVWLNRRNKAETRKVSTLHRALQDYAVRLQSAGRLTEGEIHDLPHGSMYIAPGESRLERDDAALLAWAQANRPDLVEKRLVVQWHKLLPDLHIVDLQAIDITKGCPVAGVTVKPSAPHIVIQAKPPAHA